MSMIFPNLTATFARILTLSVLGLLGILVCCPGAAAEVKNSLVGYCGSDSKCRDYKDWSQVLYDPANKTAGYMGSCDVFRSVWSSSLYLGVNGCDDKLEEAKPGSCVPCDGIKYFKYLCPPPKK